MSAAEGILANPPDVDYPTTVCVGEFAALPLSFLQRNTDIVRRSIRARRARKERRMSLIEHREVQQLYEEIMRRTDPAFHP